MRVVIDTNVLVSAYFWRGNERRVVRRGIMREFEPVVSVATLRELEGVLVEDFQLPTESAKSYILLLGVVGTLVSPAKFKQPVCRDPDDDRVLEAAIASGSRFIVTGDRDLLDMAIFRGITIDNARRFLGRLAPSR